MMHQLLNTLFVQTQGSYVHLHQDTVRVEVEGQVRLQVPLHHLGGLAVFGNVAVSPFLIHRFAEDGRSLAWFSLSGRFVARVQGPTLGNVLLRVAQHEARADPEWVLHLARHFIAGKLHNARQLLQRGARERAATAPGVGSAIVALKDALDRLEDVTALDALRGIEGMQPQRTSRGCPAWCLGTSRARAGAAGRDVRHETR